MSNNNINNKKAFLTFEGKQYDIDAMEEETKNIIKKLQIADAQLKLHQDTLNLISIGRDSLANELRKKLETI